MVAATLVWYLGFAALMSDTILQMHVVSARPGSSLLLSESVCASFYVSGVQTAAAHYSYHSRERSLHSPTPSRVRMPGLMHQDPSFACHASVLGAVACVHGALRVESTARVQDRPARRAGRGRTQSVPGRDAGQPNSGLVTAVVSAVNCSGVVYALRGRTLYCSHAE